MAALDPISAAEYNNIRASIAQQVGRFNEWTEHGFSTSTTTSGYGRNFTSDLVVGGNTLGVSDIVSAKNGAVTYPITGQSPAHSHGSHLAKYTAVTNLVLTHHRAV